MAASKRSLLDRMFPAPGKAIRPSLANQEAVRRAYRRWAPVYDELFAPIARSARKSAVRHINQSTGRVLEVGVGTGVALPDYAPHLEIVGVDLSPDMLAAARRRVSRAGLRNVEAILEMDAAALAFPDASFDTVVAMHVVTVTPEPEAVMSELERVCRPGGEVVLVNHFSAEEGARAAIETVMAPFADRIGWHADFAVEKVLGQSGLVLEHRQSLPPAGLFTMMRFRRRVIAGARCPACAAVGA